MTLDERFDRFLGSEPRIAGSAFVAEGAAIVGDVEVGERASVWFHTALRGDINRIVIGESSNVQDGAVVHVADAYAALVGSFVTIGHCAIVHACTVEDEVLVGMHATILDGAKVGARSIIGANALVTGGMEIPEGSLVLGSPARVVKSLDRATRQSLRGWAEKYVALSRRYLEKNQLRDNG